jgi:hypothetical protein
MGGEVDLGVPAGDGGGVGADEEARPQGQGAQDEGYAGAGGRGDAPSVRDEGRPLAAGGSDDDGDQDAGARQLCEHRAEGGPGDAEVEAVDEDDVEDDVGHVAADGDLQGGPGVLQSAEHTGGGQHQQQRGRAEDGDLEVGRGLVADGRAGAEELDQRAREHGSDHGDGRPDQDREPAPVDALGQRRPAVPGAEMPGDACGGAVGEEDAQADQGLEHGAGDPEAGELGGAEVSDDHRVGEQEQRLGHQREEGRHGQPQDLAVSGCHRPSVTISVAVWP